MHSLESYAYDTGIVEITKIGYGFVGVGFSSFILILSAFFSIITLPLVITQGIIYDE